MTSNASISSSPALLGFSCVVVGVDDAFLLGDGRYLQESGFVHSAFTFAYESMLGQTNARNADKFLPPGALVSFLQKGLQYVGIEECLRREGVDGTGLASTMSGKASKKNNHGIDGSVDFTLLAPQTLAALNRRNPPIQLNVPPATAAAVIKARLEIEAKLESEGRTVAPMNSLGDTADSSPSSSGQDAVMSQQTVPFSLQQTTQQQQPIQHAQQQSAIDKSVQQQMVLDAAQGVTAAAAASAMNQLQQNAMVQNQINFSTGSAGNAAAAAAAAFALQQQQRVAADLMVLQQQHQQQQQQRSLDGAAAAQAAVAALASVAAGVGTLSSIVGGTTNKGSRKNSRHGSGTATPVGPSNVLAANMPGLASLEAASRGVESSSAMQQGTSVPMDTSGGEESDHLIKPVAVPAHTPFTEDYVINGQRFDQNGLPAQHATPLNGGQQQDPAKAAATLAASVLASVEAVGQNPPTKQHRHDEYHASRSSFNESLANDNANHVPGPLSPDLEDEVTNAKPSEVLELKMHSSEVFMCAWNPVFTDLIATGSGDASARIWQMGGPEATAGLGPVRLLPHGIDPQDRKNKDVTTLEWSSDGNLLATGSYDGVARVWSRTGVLVHTLRGHRGPIFSLKWNRKGNYLLSGSYDKTTIVWDVSGSTGVVEQQFNDHQAPALDVDWKDDTTFASCSTDKTVHICKVGIPRPIRVYTGHNDEVNAVKWDPSGNLLASCSDDCTAKVWDVSSERTDPLHDFKSHKQEIYTVKW